MSDSDNRSKLGKYVPAFVFIVFIFGMAIWFLFAPKSDYSSSEKRYLQKFPDVTFESVESGKFGSEFETFFADHFPSRNFWVGLNAYYTLYTGNNGASGVYDCKNGYLINKPVSTENKLYANTDTIVNFKENIDVPVTVMLVPSTGYIAEDVLPPIHDKYNDDEYFDNVSKKLSDNGLSFVDLRDKFKSAYSDGMQLYYKTDHHWTTEGAYTAYEELCKQPGITPAAKEKFNVEAYPGFYGTTYSTSGFWFTQPDTIEVWNDPDNTENNIGVKITESGDTKEYNSMFFYDHIDEDDKYPVFLDGNHALTEITNSNAKGGTLLMVKDSFGHCLAPFLAENYSKIVMVDMRYYKMSVSDLIKAENPEQVLFMYGVDNLATDADIAWIK